MKEKIKGINIKESVWTRLRDLAYDNRVSIPKFIIMLLNKWENKL